MNSSNSQIPKPVSPLQCVATVVTLKRLIVVVGIVPLVVAASPLVLGVYLAAINFITSGFGFLLTIVALFFVILGRFAISFCAPTTQQRDDALSKSRVSLPLASLLLGWILIHYVLDPVAALMGLSDVLMFSPKLPYTVNLQLSACMLLLGGAVFARFVGPISVGKTTYQLLTIMYT